MTYDLRQLIRAQGKRRKPGPLRVKTPPKRLVNGLEAALQSVVRAAASGGSERLNSEQILAAQDWLAYAAQWNRRNWESTFQSQFGVDLRGLATSMHLDPEVQVAFRWLLELMDDLHRQTVAKLRLAAVAAEALPGGTATLTREAVAEVLKAQKRRAHLIAHDQAQKILAKINERQQVEGGITKYRWNHSFLPNPRRHHVERQGNIYSWSRPPRGGHPGTEIQCRCTAEPYLG